MSSEQPTGAVARLTSWWTRLARGGPTPEQERAMEMRRAQSQVEQERLNAHRHTGHFGGTGW